MKRIAPKVHPIELDRLTAKEQVRDYGQIFMLFGLEKELELTQDQIEQARITINQCVKERTLVSAEKLKDVLLPHQIKRLNQIYNQTVPGFDPIDFTFGLTSLKDGLNLTEKQVDKINATAESERKTYYDLFWSEIKKFKTMRKAHLKKQLENLNPNQARIFKKTFGDVVLAPTSIPFIRLPSTYLRTIDFRPPPAFDLDGKKTDSKKTGVKKTDGKKQR